MDNKNTSLIKILIFSFLFFSFFFGIAFAASAFELAQKLRNFIDNAIRVGVILAFLSLVWGGFLYLTSTGNEKQLQKAKDQIFKSFLGVLILLAGWVILSNIRVGLRELAPVEPLPIVEAPKNIPEKEGMYLPFAEIPVETYIKGGEDNKSFLLDVELIKEIQKIFEEELVPALKKINEDADKIVNLMNQCSCSANTEPKGGGTICTTQEKTVGTTTIKYCEKTDCWVEKCVGDPCKNVRDDIARAIQENMEDILKVMEIKEKLEGKIISMMEPIAKFYYVITKGMQQCPDYLVFNREYLSAIKDIVQLKFKEITWVVSRVPFLEEIKNLRKWSFADFYCPKAGITSHLPTQKDVNELQKEYERLKDALEKKQEEKELLEQEKEYLGEALKEAAPQHEFALACPLSIPFGEVMEKILEPVTQLRDNILLITALAKEMTEELDNLHRVYFQCGSDLCDRIGECGSADANCPCLRYCRGTGCPMMDALAKKAIIWAKYEAINNFISTNQNLIKKIEKWIEQWEKIENRVRKRGTPLTQEEIKKIYQDYPEAREVVAFELMAARMHYCFAQAKDVEAGWSLTSCQSSLGLLNPENKLITNINEDCKCATSTECKTSFPILETYRCRYFSPHWLQQYLPWLVAILDFLGIHIEGDCYNFNFFCCRLSKTK
jgi:cell division protein FtsB